ncbi:class I SAM-dependent methyltransferase [Aequorivita sediminis]|uniref:class I SAM-dependent methyltransferase n=1 Tax=Aequorivita sediminis TaxID=3073653 RepID=UPI0028B25702|nr:class I SAM-dependent methyltransferase [Aequorivita sp. F6058]
MKKENNKIKKPWPTKAAMAQVYEKKLWGDNNTDFYSGEGSHHLDLVNPYIDVVTSFLNSFEKPITVCDLGCGDFNIGKELFKHTEKYIGVDIVDALIARNKSLFKAENLEFYCLDAAVDNLPFGDCVLLRQVLQHLSNSEVQQIVNKLGTYKYVVLTEHLPQRKFKPNKDIISGQGIRLKKQSGINLLLPPFNMKVNDEKQLLAIPLKGSSGVIVTTLYKLF